ncbi:unnamed protein product [Rhizopus stolonifer]
MTEMPIEVLRVEQTAVSKELLRFRSCNVETRSMYCREWAQYVYKKHFVWNARTQEEVEQSAETIQAGKYHLKLLDNATDDDDSGFEKLKSVQWIQQFEDEFSKDTPPMDRMVEACRQWILMPSAHSGLPDIFEPVEFNSYPDAIPLNPDDPSQLLDPLIIERQALCLPSDCFHLLKSLTGDIILSHTTPTCEHRKPQSKTPADLEVDRAILIEHEHVAVQNALKDLALALDRVWQPLVVFLESLEKMEKRRSELLGQDCQASIDAYFVSQKYTPFVDHWTTQATSWKKKSSDEEVKKLDDYVQAHFDHLVSLVDQFLDVFVKSRFDEIREWNTDLFKMAEPMLADMKEPLPTLEQLKDNQTINASEKRIRQELDKRAQEFKQEIQSLLKAYRESSRPSLSSRVDRLNHKDFKKKIKKVESGYYTLRQYFRYELTENIYPGPFFGKFVLICLSPLMMKGEVMEVVAIKEEMKRFVESHKELLKERFILLSRFEEGVQTGRKELAGIVGKLLLKEGMRIQGESVALQRQNNLLKTFGVAPTESESSKKKKGKKKNDSGTSTPLQEEKAVPSPAALKKKLAETKKKEEPKKSVVQKQPEPVKKEEPKPVSVKSLPQKPIPVPESIKRAAEAKFTASRQPVPPSVVQKPVVAAELVQKTAPVPEPIKPSVPVVVEKTPEVKKVPVIVEKVAPSVQKPVVHSPPVQKPMVVPPNIKKVADKPKKYVSKVAPAPILDPPIPKVPEIVKKPTKTESSKKTKTPVKKETIEPTKTLEPMKAPEPAVEPEGKEETKVDDEIKGWADIVASITEDHADAWDPEAPIIEAVTEPLVNTKTGWETVPAVETPRNDWGANVATDSGWGSSNETNATSVVIEQDWNPPVETSQGWNPASVETNQGWNPASVETKHDWNAAAPIEAKQGWNSPAETKQDWNTAPLNESWNSMKQNVKKSNPEWRRKDTANPEWRALNNNQTDTKPKEDTLGSWGNNQTESWTSNDTKKKTWSSLKENNEPLASWGNTSNQTNESWERKPTDSWENKTETNVLPPAAKPPGLAFTETPQQQPGLNFTSQESVQPPGLSFASQESSQPPGIPFASQEPVQPPGLSFATPEPAKPLMSFGEPAKPAGMTDTSLPFHSFMSNVTTQFQEPLPANVDEFGKDMLLLMVKNLHRENSTLISSVYSQQQDMAMMNKRYTEVMALTRERETQTVQLLETRQKTELEKAKAYVISLESRIKELEQNKAQTVGFGNQDLFAGYRDEMKSPTNNYQRNNTNKKMWQKSAVIRCGNCGETGHSSSDCKSYCRYCGSLEHLSESCPMH